MKPASSTDNSVVHSWHPSLDPMMSNFLGLSFRYHEPCVLLLSLLKPIFATAWAWLNLYQISTGHTFFSCLHGFPHDVKACLGSRFPSVVQNRIIVYFKGRHSPTQNNLSSSEVHESCQLRNSEAQIRFFFARCTIVVPNRVL